MARDVDDQATLEVGPFAGECPVARLTGKSQPGFAAGLAKNFS